MLLASPSCGLRHGRRGLLPSWRRSPSRSGHEKEVIGGKPPPPPLLLLRVCYETNGLAQVSLNTGFRGLPVQFTIGHAESMALDIKLLDRYP